ncbi:hypothetical protein AMTRI_Chr08g163990 [Amborella trichopoda]
MAGFAELGSKLISEFVSECPIQCATDIVLLRKRKLQSIDDFSEYSKSYNNYILELVLVTLSMKNLSVQNLVTADVVGFARGEIKKLCCKDNTRTYFKAGSKVCNTIEGVEECNIPKFRKIHRRRNFKPYTSSTKETRG